MSAINVSLVNAATGKSQVVALPRAMTVAELQTLAPGQAAALTVAGCAPAPAATLGDLYDACAADSTLQVVVAGQRRMGYTVCLGCCGWSTDSSSSSSSTPPASGGAGGLGGLTGGAGSGAGAGNGLGGLGGLTA